MKKKNKSKVLGPAYSSYHGKVHVPLIRKDDPVFLGEGIYMNSGCAGHVVVERLKSPDSGIADSGE